MTKIISVILFAFALTWTWFAFHSKSEMGIDVHAGIQSKLAQIIEDTIKKKRESSSDFKLIRMYTQQVDNGKVSAQFSYEYVDKLSSSDVSEAEGIKQKISGTAILSKTVSEDPSIQKWVIVSIKTGVDSLDFEKGLVITSDGQETPESAKTKE